MPMTGFESQTYGVGSDRSANCVTTTARTLFWKLYLEETTTTTTTMTSLSVELTNDE